ncbi:MAG: ATP-dependent helicase [Thermodesulfobacteriota bacterium]
MRDNLHLFAPPPEAGIDFAARLNPPQYEAVSYLGGPLLVIAGAGSGKTRTLVYRLAWLVGQGVPPATILLLTFTRRAAQEMLLRASRLLDDSCRQVCGGTFHSVGNLLLRRYAHVLGYAANFTIIDRPDAEGILNLLKSSLDLGGSGRKFPGKRVVADVISRAVNRSLTVEEVIADQYAHLDAHTDDILRIADHYRTFKKDHQLMDYDDLLVGWRRLMVEFPETGKMIAGQFTHVLVDEYQDTNHLQAEIVHGLAGVHGNVMAVGDDAQSIYSFRGADFRNIMEFPGLFPGARVVRLEENYRSTNAILSVANAVMEHAREKYEKNLYTNIAGGERPQLVAARDEGEQARYIAAEIRRLQEGGTPLDEIAVLFRSGFHSFKLELELASQGYRFEKRGGMKLTESSHVKDVISFLRVLNNPADRLSWSRILLLLDKVGPRTVEKMVQWLLAGDEPLARLQSYPGAGKWKPALAAMAAMLQQASRRALPAEILELVLAWYQPVFERIYADDYPRRMKDLEQLSVIVAGYGDLQAVIDDTALDPPESTGEPAGTDAGRLVLSTIHSAKGLEWDAVFVIHLAEGKFPGSQAMLDDNQEEERRLFYVAVTRARRHLYLCYPRQSTGFDRSTTYHRMSPLLEEVPLHLLRSSAASAPVVGRSSPSRPPTPPPAPAEPVRSFAAGSRVKHPFFGEGKVAKVVGPRTVEVVFARHGTKTLHLDYARLEAIDGGGP